MKKKLSLILAAGFVAIIAGATWASLAPVAGAGVALLEFCAGYACGYFYRREIDSNSISKLSVELEQQKELNDKLMNAPTSSTVKVSTVRKKTTK